MIPPVIRESLIAWVIDTRPPGGFVRAVLCNDLKESFERADHINQQCMLQIVTWMVCNMPMASYGCKENVEMWKGLPEDYKKGWLENLQ